MLNALAFETASQALEWTFELWLTWLSNMEVVLSTKVATGLVWKPEVVADLVCKLQLVAQAAQGCYAFEA